MSENAREQGATADLPSSCKCVKGTFNPADTNTLTRREFFELLELLGSDMTTTRCNS